MIKYFGVFYSKDNTIHLFPGDTQEECLDKLDYLINSDPRVKERCLATTVVKRDMDNFKEGFIFGNPKSLNVMNRKENR